MSTSGTSSDISKQSRSTWDVDVTPCLTKIHKINDKIPSTRHDNLPEHDPIPKSYIKRPHPRGNHTRVPKLRLKQAKDNIWSIYTILYRHHQQYQ